MKHDPLWGIAFAEFNYLRMEALEILDLCLTEGNPGLLEAFVEEQMVQDPPRLDLLRELAEDIHQRLLSLRESHFEARERALHTLRSQYCIDTATLLENTPYRSTRNLNPDDVLRWLRQNPHNAPDVDELAVRKFLESSLDMTTQLQHDVRLTEYLYEYINDWVMGLNTAMMRQYWSQMPNNFLLAQEHVQ